MTDWVKIEPIKNAWKITYRLFLTPEEETYSTFEEIIGRIAVLLDVDHVESQF